MSELALRLIAENKRTSAKFLDLGNCGLTEIPAEIAELVWLEAVSFASRWYEFYRNLLLPKKSQNDGPENSGLASS